MAGEEKGRGSLNGPLEHYLYLSGKPAYNGAPVRNPPLSWAQIMADAGSPAPKLPTGDEAYVAVVRAWEGMKQE